VNRKPIASNGRNSANGSQSDTNSSSDRIRTRSHSDSNARHNTQQWDIPLHECSVVIEPLDLHKLIPTDGHSYRVPKTAKRDNRLKATDLRAGRLGAKRERDVRLAAKSMIKQFIADIKTYKWTVFRDSSVHIYTTHELETGVTLKIGPIVTESNHWFINLIIIFITIFITVFYCKILFVLIFLRYLFIIQLRLP